MWLFCGTGCAQPLGPAAELKAPTEAIGDGETVEAAKKAALTKAVEKLKGFMTMCEFTSFVVNEDYVRKYVLVDAGRPGEDVRVDNIEKPFKSWKLTFRAGYTNDLVRRDLEAQRKIRSEERQFLGSRIIIGLSFLLLAGFAYVRLDEYTHRRYTNWLRLAGVGVATTLIAGWWWIFFLAPGN
jgi:hypothetical protein